MKRLIEWVIGLAALCIAMGCTASHANEPEGLRSIVARSFPAGNVAIGVAVHGKNLDADSALRAIVDREFGYITPANEFKQAVVYQWPQAAWNWKSADREIERAKQQQQVVRIHGPVGPQVSKWMKQDERTPAEVSTMLEAWLPALCRRYASEGPVRWLDVVNETVDIAGRWMGPKPGIARADSPWLMLGMSKEAGLEIPTYVLRAFELANQHCGGLKLIINQHVITPPAVAKLKLLVAAVRAKGLRVDGIGWQAHADIGWQLLPGRMRWLTDLIDWAQANQLEFHITEANAYMPAGVSVLDERAQADTFVAILGALLERRERGLVAWTLWHARDDQTDNASRLGCLWNNANQPKQAYFAVRDLLANPPPALGPLPDTRR